MQMPLFQSVSTTAVNASYALLIGVVAAQYWLRRPGGGMRQEGHENLQTAMGIGFIVAAGATILSLWQASATMAGVPLLASGPDLWVMFAGTSYGTLGLASLLVLVVGAGLHFGLRRRWQNAVVRAALPSILVAFAICRVATGHAAENGVVSVDAAIELIHVLSMASWFGSVVVAAWVVLPGVARTAAPVRIAPYLGSLSNWATAALAGVLTTGLYNGFRVLNAPVELMNTEYGWVLTTKLCFVGIAIALGGWNRFVGFPAAAAAANAPDTAKNNLHAITSLLRVESIALLIVLLAAAVLTASAPPTST